jgi:hypothetical protein
MPSPIFTPRFQTLLRRMFNLVGPSGLESDDVVLPVANVWDPQAPELYGLRGDRLAWGVGGPQAGTAALFPACSCVNPAGSGILMVVTEIDFDIQGASGPVQISITNAPPPTDDQSSQYTDGRFRSGALLATAAPVGFCGNYQVAASQGRGIAVGITGQASPNFSTPYQLRTRIILTPGLSVQVTNLAVAAVTNIMRASFQWYERNVEPNELTA